MALWMKNTPISPNELKPVERKPMSIVGLQPGTIADKLAAMKKSAQDDRAAAMAKLDAAAQAQAQVNAKLSKVAADVQKEADDALQEFAQFTNE